MAPKARKLARDKDKVLEALAKAGNVRLACQSAGISRMTLYRWRVEDEPFDLACEEALRLGKEEMNDLAQSRLLQAIERGELKAVTYQLSRRHPDYRYPRNVEPTLDGVIEDQLITNAARLTLSWAAVKGDPQAAAQWLKVHDPAYSAQPKNAAAPLDYTSEDDLEEHLAEFDRSREGRGKGGGG